MLDYRLRVHRRYPNKQMHQVVIYLRRSNSELAQQTVFELPQTRHQFNVIRLWEVDYSKLLTAPGVWLCFHGIFGSRPTFENLNIYFFWVFSISSAKSISPDFKVWMALSNPSIWARRRTDATASFRSRTTRFSVMFIFAIYFWITGGKNLFS